jgi:putative transcriptional regulator
LYCVVIGVTLSPMSDTASPFLDGKLLIAMPGMGDPRFHRSVIFMCAHSSEGAMGLIVNKPAADLRVKDLLAQLSIDPERTPPEARVHFGGPVEHARGFVLHSADYAVDGSTLQVSDRFSMTATVEILQAIARGEGPRKALLALGYSGWGPGQLEGEIQANGWLTATAEPGLVFDSPDAAKWEAALKSLHIDPLLLVAGGGRA